MALSTKPYKGARDFYPEDKRLQKYLFAKWREACEKFGYEEYDAPILEPLEIYLAKSGDEIINEQTYLFTDRGDRQVVIRPEMTPTVSRMVAAKRQELTYPLRWYSIPNLWRYERPQKGRLREHWQLNVDIFGVSSVEAEVEIILLIDEIFKGFGASPEQYDIKLNSRKLIDQILKELKLSEKQSFDIKKLIDRMQKMPSPAFLSKLDEILKPAQRSSGIAEMLMSVLNAKDLKQLPEFTRSLPAIEGLTTVISKLSALGIKSVRFDPTIMRGFDYYTDIVFEVFDNNPDNNRSMLGGGRYDGLVGLFGVPPVPTVGFGWGDVTLLNFLGTHNLLPELSPEVNLFVALLEADSIEVQKIIKSLRRNDVNVFTDLSGRKVGDQLRSALKKDIEFFVVIGENELKTKQYSLKNLKTNKEDKLSLDDLIKRVRKP